MKAEEHNHEQPNPEGIYSYELSESRTYTSDNLIVDIAVEAFLIRLRLLCCFLVIVRSFRRLAIASFAIAFAFLRSAGDHLRASELRHDVSYHRAVYHFDMAVFHVHAEELCYAGFNILHDFFFGVRVFQMCFYIFEIGVEGFVCVVVNMINNAGKVYCYSGFHNLFSLLRFL